MVLRLLREPSVELRVLSNHVAAGAGQAEAMERERSLVSARDRFLPATPGTEAAGALAALLAA